jgi:UDP-glucose 4-epimerase
VRPELLPLLPLPSGLRFQAVHSVDVGDAYRLAVRSDARGAFNIAADPVLDGAVVGRAFKARPVAVPAPMVRAAAAATWRLRLQPTPPGWMDMALAVPIMDVRRAREELGWAPRHTAVQALEDLLQGLRDHAQLSTPPLARATSGPLRSRELRTGVGGH